MSGLLAKVEAGEEVVIVLGSEPVARPTWIAKALDLEAVIAETRAAGQS